MRVDLLCSGSKGNCCLIRSEKAQIVIDCGSTKRHLMQAFKAVDAVPENTHGIFITHTHSDHISQKNICKYSDVLVL